MRLYYVPKTRATRPRWVLEELGVPYELVRLDPSRGETHAPEHLARHPLGHVPVLEDGPTTLFESVAICLYLAERYPERPLAPQPGTPLRGQLYQWLCYAMTELEPQLSALSAERRRPEPERDLALAEAAGRRYANALRPLEGALHPGPWLLGAGYSVGDVVCGSILLWGRSLRVGGELPAVEAYLARLKERPAWRRAHAD